MSPGQITKKKLTMQLMTTMSNILNACCFDMTLKSAISVMLSQCQHVRLKTFVKHRQQHLLPFVSAVRNVNYRPFVGVLNQLTSELRNFHVISSLVHNYTTITTQIGYAY